VIAHPELLKPCLPGKIGEVWVAGPSVAQGYWNLPEETENVFRAYLADTGEGPFLRTGDLGFLLNEELFITGRLKDLIIIRGLNHYPQDIEMTVVRCHPSLRPGCGAAFSVEADGEERLVIVQEVDRHSQYEARALVELIRQVLAEEHGIQVYAVALIRPGSIPKTSSGKLQRHAARAAFSKGELELLSEWREGFMSVDASADVQTISTPQTLEEIIAWLRAHLAARFRISPADLDINQPITRYGADSLTSVELAQHIKAGLGVDVPWFSLLQSPSIGELAAQTLAQLTLGVTAPEVSLAPDGYTPPQYPLSYGQQALWFLQQVDPESTAYHIVSAMRIQSPLDRHALREAFQVLVDRHPSLRTTFHETADGPVQLVHHYQQVCFREEDASELDKAEFDERLVSESQRPFDLEQGPLLRLTLFTRAEPESLVLLLAVHHLIADFWSLAVLMNEFSVLYSGEKNGAPAQLLPVSLQYHDYVRWQRKMLAGAEGERLQTYWEKQLQGAPSILNLPTDHTRPAVQTYSGASRSFRLDPELSSQLKALGQAHDATLYMILLAAFQILLYRYSEQEDFIVGSPTSGRAAAEVAGLVGYLVNPLALRATFSENTTVSDFVRQVRDRVLTAFEHQDYPFPLMVERLQPERDVSRSPLFQVMFILQNIHLSKDEGLAALALGEAGANLEFDELSLESMTLQTRVAQFDLTLIMAEAGDELVASLQYNTDLFDTATIERMTGHFQRLLQSIVADPDHRVAELQLLTSTEKNQLLVEWNSTEKEYPSSQCVHQLIEAQIKQTPDEIAIIFEDQQLTYAELDREANQLAHYLRKLGVVEETRVGICMERSLKMVVSLLAVLKAGAAYVPLDPSYPRARLAFMLEDARTLVLLTQSTLRPMLPEHEAKVVCLDTEWEQIAQQSHTRITSTINSNNIAYVIYTSGSTGSPKGVMVTHCNVANFFTAMDGQLGEKVPGVWLAVTSISFDISVLELLWTLARGFQVVLQPELVAASPRLEPSLNKVPDTAMDFSLFYFASDEAEVTKDKYQLLLEGARFADRNGFSAVWTPERHFHHFGGLYPNPSVTGAAIAAITEQVQIRAGSVVLPLHNPIRVAEEWSVVDNLSKGRVGISFASGWQANDFVLGPDSYLDRKEITLRGIETVRRLWRGEAVTFKGATGEDVPVKILPHPIQRELPVWVTAAGHPETFRQAGAIGARLLTHLLGQTVEELTDKIAIYRDAWRSARHTGSGYVTLMLHTFIGEDVETVRQKVRKPFGQYLRTSFNLMANFGRNLRQGREANDFTPDDLDVLEAHAFERYFETSGLFGSPDTCLPLIDRLKTIGVNEVACLIDFGVDTDSVMSSLHYLDILRKRSDQKCEVVTEDYSIAAQIVRHHISHLQCTPSLAQTLRGDVQVRDALGLLRHFLLGGEVLPISLARELGEMVTGEMRNMYGPTETTIWSATHRLSKGEALIPIGKPIANTQAYVLDKYLQPVPIGIRGELYLGGEGVVRGYWQRPELTAERFIPHPFSRKHGARLYRTGDLARYLPNANIEYLGRADTQVKVRGYRIELGEIEAVMSKHASVRQCAVIVREDGPPDKQLVAYVVASAEAGAPVESSELRSYLREQLPEYMLPSAFVFLEDLPLTPNGKLDRHSLPSPDLSRGALAADFLSPRTAIEQVVAFVWAELLDRESISVDDDFFSLGGHSLLATHLVARIRETLEVNLSLREFFKMPTVAGVANSILRHSDKPREVEIRAQLMIDLAQLSDEQTQMMLDQRTSSLQEVVRE
jgi:natural product biosynthesis luciferase-like monooxygenase protein